MKDDTPRLGRSVPPPPPPQAQQGSARSPWATRAVWGVVVLVLMAWATTHFLRNDNGDRQVVAEEAPYAAGPAGIPPPPPEPEPPPMVRAMQAAGTDFEAARQVLVNYGNDSVENVDPATAIFSMWSAANLDWNDVAVGKDETSLPRVAKDSTSERGKRMCVRGRIIEIARDRSIPEPMWLGGMFTPRGDIVRFFAVGGSGDLVARSRARICGVVGGRYVYSNAAGGTAHAVALVGMFDLPENR